MKGFNIGIQNAKTIINIESDFMGITTIEFQDNGQDFLEWDIDNRTGKVLDCRPFQAQVWCKFFVGEPDSLKVGDMVRICEKPLYAAKFDDQIKQVNYPIERVTRK